MTLSQFVNTATEIQYNRKSNTIWLWVYPINEDGMLGKGYPVKLDRDTARRLARNLNYKVIINEDK